MNAVAKSLLLVLPTSLGTLVQDLGEIKNVIASVAVVIGAILAIAPNPLLLRISGVAAIVVSTLTVVIADLKSAE
jgi:hypothetical protein